MLVSFLDKTFLIRLNMGQNVLCNVIKTQKWHLICLLCLNTKNLISLYFILFTQLIFLCKLHAIVESYMIIIFFYQKEYKNTCLDFSFCSSVL